MLAGQGDGLLDDLLTGVRRKPKHDLGSVQNIVQNYLRQRTVLRPGDVKGRDANSSKKASKRR